MREIIIQFVILVAMVGAFVVGKYVFPQIKETGVIGKLQQLAAWADKFVVWARYFKDGCTGEEKMAFVIEQLQGIAQKAGIDVTVEELQAIIQAAYESMIAGESAADGSDGDKAAYYDLGTGRMATGSTVIVNVAPNQAEDKVETVDRETDGAAQASGDDTEGTNSTQDEAPKEPDEIAAGETVGGEK